ncbi:hypothetical protein Trco_008366 [Trichoderma cornu-damae]|uniref:Uncharacterized protein n=1 Tax=Trichoderma cornu-damae TaxID=654480 RepID=A0A9P8TRE1_9HYPO|nr:hypothetical protein Trco_008366 [Trichoderma cornu-damae]
MDSPGSCGRYVDIALPCPALSLRRKSDRNQAQGLDLKRYMARPTKPEPSMMAPGSLREVPETILVLVLAPVLAPSLSKEMAKLGGGSGYKHIFPNGEGSRDVVAYASLVRLAWQSFPRA